MSASRVCLCNKMNFCSVLCHGMSKQCFGCWMQISLISELIDLVYFILRECIDMFVEEAWCIKHSKFSFTCTHMHA